MKKLSCIFLCILLLVSIPLQCFALESPVDQLVDWASGAYGTVVGTGIGRTVVVE